MPVQIGSGFHPAEELLLHPRAEDRHQPEFGTRTEAATCLSSGSSLLRWSTGAEDGTMNPTEYELALRQHRTRVLEVESDRPQQEPDQSLRSRRVARWTAEVGGVLVAVLIVIAFAATRG